MGMEPDFLELLTTQVEYERWLGTTDTQGNEEYGPALPKQCRINTYTHMRGSSRQQDVVRADHSDLSIILDYFEPIPTVHDKFTLPDGRVPRLTEVNVYYDEVGTAHHIEVACDTGEQI